VSLEVIDGPDKGLGAELRGRQLRIGADPSNVLKLTDPSVSRFHCKLVADDHGYRIVDRGSANGTVVNGMRVRDVYLDGATMLELGHSKISVSFGEQESDIELSTDEHFGAAVGRSVGMRELFATAKRAAGADATVLLLGETGTGKDVIARAIHDHSPRAARAYRVFDCGAVSANLIESELFGHVKGAFTGADNDRVGAFEVASGGTLFIDEIGELDLSLQPKLLRVLETGSVTRVGATRPISVDVRIIAATNRDLRQEVDADRFRSDLFYRLAVIPLEIPPLRERQEDIPLLAAHFLRHILAIDNADAARLRAHMDQAFAALTRYRWPGNVRELRNVVERAATFADTTKLSEDFFTRLVEVRESVGRSLRTRPPLKDAREQFDREYLRDVLEAAHGDVQRAAEVAEVHPKSFSRLLRRYGVTR
jgi:transcriptional regulator with GAF, ATPase, and Fis domain